MYMFSILSKEWNSSCNKKNRFKNKTKEKLQYNNFVNSTIIWFMNMVYKIKLHVAEKLHAETYISRLDQRLLFPFTNIDFRPNQTKYSKNRKKKTWDMYPLYLHEVPQSVKSLIGYLRLHAKNVNFDHILYSKACNFWQILSRSNWIFHVE